MEITMQQTDLFGDIDMQYNGFVIFKNKECVPHGLMCKTDISKLLGSKKWKLPQRASYWKRRQGVKALEIALYQIFDLFDAHETAECANILQFIKVGQLDLARMLILSVNPNMQFRHKHRFVSIKV